MTSASPEATLLGIAKDEVSLLLNRARTAVAEHVAQLRGRTAVDRRCR